MIFFVMSPFKVFVNDFFFLSAISECFINVDFGKISIMFSLFIN